MEIEKLFVKKVAFSLCAGALLGANALMSCSSARAQDQAKIEGGELVYREYCQTCHGDDLVNTGQTFDLRRFKANERARFENSVLNGKNQMPPWKGEVSLEQIDLLWNYVRANAFQK